VSSQPSPWLGSSDALGWWRGKCRPEAVAVVVADGAPLGAREGVGAVVAGVGRCRSGFPVGLKTSSELGTEGEILASAWMLLLSPSKEGQSAEHLPRPHCKGARGSLEKGHGPRAIQPAWPLPPHHCLARLEVMLRRVPRLRLPKGGQ